MTQTGRRRAPRRGVSGPLAVLVLTLSTASLFMEQADFSGAAADVFIQIVDFAMMLLLLVETLTELSPAGRGGRPLRGRLGNLAFLLAFSALFAWTKVLHFSGTESGYAGLPATLLALRNAFVVLKVFGRIRRLAAFLRSLSVRPALTVLLSFALVIVAGAVMLMLGFTTTDGKGLSFIDAMFTATSGVCVTGLIVVDTATAFTFWGRLALLVLIQVGGLGIMILSFFVAFIMKRSLTVEETLLVSYMTNERDMSNLGRSIRRIIYATLLIEGTGAVLLFAGFAPRLGASAATAFTAVFHAVSAFCNAGFSLFSDSLEGFRSDPFVTLVICALVISGGLSFAVLVNLRERFLPPRAGERRKALSVNTRVVLAVTAILLGGGTLLLYASEHGGTLRTMDLGAQYLAAFFQSVSARTAGFNTIPFGGLRASTYLILISLMLVGAASGSTAGGIKVNSAGILFAYVRSVLKDREHATLFSHSVSRDLVLRAFLILLFASVTVGAGALVLSFTEAAPFLPLLFEAVSAFATVGLSAGVTAGLSTAGKCVIILLMFVGRIGPLTVLAAAAWKRRRTRIEYPDADILVG